MKLVAKVDLTRASDPVEHVAQVLRRIDKDVQVEEVFPGLRTGASAGLVTVTRSAEADDAIERKILKALQDDEAIAYVDTPKPRRLR